MEFFSKIFYFFSEELYEDHTNLFQIELSHKTELIAGTHSYCFVPCNDKAVADKYLLFDESKTKVWVNNQENMLTSGTDYYFPKTKDGLKFYFTSEKVSKINDGDKIFVQTRFAEIKRDEEIYFHFYGGQ